MRVHDRLLLDLGVPRDEGRDALTADKKGEEVRCHEVRSELTSEEESEVRSFASMRRDTHTGTISFRLCTPLNFCAVYCSNLGTLCAVAELLIRELT